MHEPRHDLDVLGLQSSGGRSAVELGDIDISYAIRGATVHSEMNELPTANATLDTTLIAGQPVDYFAEFRVGRARSTRHGFWFQGSVTDAVPDEHQAVELDCMTHPFMKERLVSGFAARNVAAPEITHVMARSAGLREEQIQIEGLDNYLPLEAVEIIVPLSGVTTDAHARIGSISIVPPAWVERISDSFRDVSEGSAEFGVADACAVGVHVCHRMYDAEKHVIEAVDVALAWLTVRSRYGLALLPDGTPQRFHRSAATAWPNRGSFLIARGLQSGRSWMRDTADPLEHSSISLPDTGSDWTIPADHALTLQDRQALLACARAARGTDQLQRVQAIWEAVEFYVEGTNVGKQFAKADIKQALASMSSEVAPALRERLCEVARRDVNNSSLAMRLDKRLRLDGVPISPDERRLLKDLRDRRNDAVHGRPTQLPTSDEVDRAVGIVSRMLLHRLSR